MLSVPARVRRDACLARLRHCVADKARRAPAATQRKGRAAAGRQACGKKSDLCVFGKLWPGEVDQGQAEALLEWQVSLTRQAG